MSHACIVCQDGNDAELAWVALYECGHVFHDTCIFGWTNVAPKKVCPICKVPIESDDHLRIFLNCHEDGTEKGASASTSPGHMSQASVLQIRRLESLCETVEASLKERQAEIAIALAKGKEDKRRIDTLCQQARVAECALAKAITDRDRARMQNDSLQQVVKAMRERNEALEAKDMEHSMLHDVDLDRGALAKLTRGKDPEVVIATQQSVLEERNMERKQFMEKVSLSCAAQRKAEQKVAIAEEENARLRGRIKQLKDVVDDKERSLLKQDFKVDQLGEELRRAKSAQIPVGGLLDRNGASRLPGPMEKLTRGGNALDGFRKPVVVRAQTEGFEALEGYCDGDLHFEAEDSDDDNGIRSDGDRNENGVGVSGAADPGYEDGLEVFPTSFRFAPEDEEAEQATGRKSVGLDGRPPEDRNEEFLEEVDRNSAGELDGLRIRRGGGLPPGDENRGVDGTAGSVHKAGGVNNLQPGAFVSAGMGRKGAGSTFVAAVRNSILENKRAKFGCNPSRAAGMGAAFSRGGASILGKRPPPPSLLQASQRIKAPTASCDKEDDELSIGAADSDRSGLGGRGAPESQVSGGFKETGLCGSKSSQPLIAPQSDRIDGFASVRYDESCQMDPDERVYRNILGQVGSTKAKGASSFSAAGCRKSKVANLLNRAAVKRTQKVTDFFGKKRP